MINSNQVSAMMAQQAQQQNMLTMGSPSPVLGQSQYPPQFSFGVNPGILGGYNANTLGNFTGTNMAASMVSGTGSALSTMGSIGSLAAMFGFGGGYTGGGLSGFMLANPLVASMMLGGAGIGMVGNAMSTGAKFNNQVGQMLAASGNFANPLGPNGFGFSFADQNRMTQQIIGMGASNPFVGQQDQMQLLNSFQQMGLDKGVTSMGKMIEKFKEFSETTETVARTLGKTVSEVTGIVHQLKGQGFYSPSEVTGQTQRMAGMGAYGIGMEQAIQMGNQMSQMSRSRGLSGSSGSVLSTNLASMFGSALNMNIIDENLMMDLTGTTNKADANAAISQGFGSRLASSLTSGSRLEGLLAGFTRVGKNGQLELDQSMLSGAASGNVSATDILTRGSTNLQTNRGNFASNRRQIASDFLKSDRGADAILGIFRNMAEQRSGISGEPVEAIFTKLMENYGLAQEREAKLLFELSDDLEKIHREKMSTAATEIAARRRRDYISRERSFAGAKARFSQRIGLYTNNPYIAGGFAAMSNRASSAFNRFERQFYGVDPSMSAMFSERAVGNFLNDFAAGTLETGDYSGSGADMLGRDLAFLGGRGMDDNTGRFYTDSFLQNSVGDARYEELRRLGAAGLNTDTLSSFNYHTGADMQGATAFTTHTGSYGYGLAGSASGLYAAGRLGGAQSMFKAPQMLAGRGLTVRTASALATAPLRAPGALARSASVVSKFGMKGKIVAAGLMLAGTALGLETARATGAPGDDERAYKELMQQAYDNGATNEEEAIAMISSQNPEAAGAISRYKASKGGGIDLLSASKAEYMSKMHGGMDLAEWTWEGTKLGAEIGAFGGVKGFAIGSIAGTILGFGAGLMYDDSQYKEAFESGLGVDLMASFSGKGDIKKFDKAFRTAMAKHGNDEEKAAAEVAKKYGTDAKSVLHTLEVLKRNSDGQDHIARLEHGTYSGAMDVIQAAKGYQASTLEDETLDSLSDALAGEEGISDLQAALVSTGGRGRNTQRAMEELARKAIAGDFEYSGDNEIMKTLAGAKDIHRDLSRFKGRSIESLDTILGKGGGAQLRKMAGIKTGGDISEKELLAMASKLAVRNSTSLAIPDATSGAAGDTETLGGSDALKAQSKLLQSTEKLAVYVDNIGAMLTGSETAGQKIPIKPINK